MEIKERIQEYLDYKGIKVTQFEVSIGASSGYWRKTKSISANIVADIAGIYSDLNLEWLFRGTGSMLIQDNIILEQTVSTKYDAEVEIDENGYLKIKIKK